MDTVRAQKTFERSTTMLGALAMHPRARWVFAAYHLNGCVPCPRSNEETIEEVAVAYKLPLERLLRDLNSLFECDWEGRRPAACRPASSPGR